MSQSLNNADLPALLPAFMRRQEDDTALAAALGAALQPLAAQIAKLPTWGALDLLPEDELDALARECAVLWYENALPIETKRALLLDADHVYQRLGTRAAVQEVATTVFGPSAVREFWEYGGEPHFFQIDVQNAGSMNAENEARLLRLFSHVKRKTQWLESINAPHAAAADLAVGAAHAAHVQATLTAATFPET